MGPWATCHLGTRCVDLWSLEVGPLGLLCVSTGQEAEDSLSTRGHEVQYGDTCAFPSQGHQSRVSMDEVSVGLTNSCETPFLPGICLSFKNHGANWTELNGEAQHRGADLPSLAGCVEGA